jgi:hypothetical protein
MVIAIDPASTFEYVLRCDRELEPEAQTVWTLRGLRHKERAEVEDAIAQSDGEGNLSLRVGSQRTRILMAGIVSVSNFQDEKGREIQVPKGGCSGVFLDHLDDAWATELANAITNRGRLSAAESD